MKKLTALLLVCVLLLGTAVPVFAAEAENAVQPRYMYLAATDAELKINSLGLASCHGKLITTTDYPVKLHIRLQQLSNSSWVTLKEWEISDTGDVSATRYYMVQSGYTYQVYVNAYVYDNNGNLLEFDYRIHSLYY